MGKFQDASQCSCNETFCNNKTVGQVARVKIQEWIMPCSKQMTTHERTKNIQICSQVVGVKVSAQEYDEGWMVSGQETVFCWIPVP